MRNHFLAGCRGLFTALAIASVILSAGTVLADQPSSVVGTEKNAGFGPKKGNEVDGQQVDRPKLFARTNYVWQFATGPFYGNRTLAVDAGHRPGVVHTEVGSFDFSRGGFTFPEELTTPVRFGQQLNQYFMLVVHPDALADDGASRLYQDIHNVGGTVMVQFRTGGFVVRLNQAGHDALSERDGVISLTPYQAGAKLAPTIGRQPLADRVKAVSDVYTLRVAVFDGENVGLVANEIAEIGGNVQRVLGNQVIVDLHRSNLADLAQIEAVRRVEEDTPRFGHGEETTSTMQTGGCGAGPGQCIIPYHDAGIKGGGHGTCVNDATPEPDKEQCVRDADCVDAGFGGSCSFAAAGQTLAVYDNGFQLDNGDMSDQKATLEVVSAGPAHRKIEAYNSAQSFGAAEGDLLGCDLSTSGGSTHGHTVAATAIGNATDVTASYIDDGSGQGYTLADADLNEWKADGVAPYGRLVGYDGQNTPLGGEGTCGSPPTISIGTLYGGSCGTPPNSSVLCDAHVDERSDIINFSFGGGEGTYGTDAEQVDEFLRENPGAMLFNSAGNSGGDQDDNGFPDVINVTSPATAKNSISVGASLNTGSSVNTRAGFTSTGPVVSGNPRVSPILMAPGSDTLGGTGHFSEYTCRSTDNDQDDPVECELSELNTGTSFAAPAAAGAAMLIRDYFAQGFYPSGTRKDGSAGTDDRVPRISGQLVKAILIASADYMTNITTPGGSLTQPRRFNNEQGYGRIQLDNAVPLSTWSPSPAGLIVVDGYSGCQDTDTTTGSCGPSNLSGLTGSFPAGNTTDTATLTVEDSTSELRVACSWADNDTGTPTAVLQNNIDIELESPSGVIYIGNFFSEDVSQALGTGDPEEGRWNATLDDAAADFLDGEDCIDDFDDTGDPTVVDGGAWSIPINKAGARLTTGCLTDPRTRDCGASNGVPGTCFDDDNPHEAIFLSPDPKGDGIEDDTDTTPDEGDDNQIETGDWTLRVIGDSIGAGGQNYACAIAGGVGIESSARFNRGRYVCTDEATISITETDEADLDIDNCANVDACLEGEVSGRVTVQVIDSGGNVVDQETGLSFLRSGTSLRFEAEDVLVTEGTARSMAATWDNDVLDVRDGETLRVVYADEDAGGATKPAIDQPFNQASTDCQTQIAFGGIVWGQFGTDSSVLVDGGCERDARGKFTFGFPDRYMDAGETLGYRIAFTSAETTVDLQDVEVTLSCVLTDPDSPFDCEPALGNCIDPERANNAACTQMNILDSPKKIGVLPAGAGVSVNFTIEMSSSISGSPEIEMLAGIAASKAGKSVEALVVSRHRLDVDERSLFYSTDFPTGGIELRDWDSEVDQGGDEIINSSGCTSGTACAEADRGTPTTSLDFTDDYRFEEWVWSNLQAGGKNTGIQAPWNFELNDGGFRVGLHNATDPQVQEPANWGEDKNFNGVLDGGEDRDPPNGLLDDNWSTRGGCGWQTKQPGATTGGAWHTGTIDFTNLACQDQCELTENIGTTISNQKDNWLDTLKTPIFEKVNTAELADGRPEWMSQHINMAWNMTMDLETPQALFTWELDLDTDDIVASNLDAFPVFNLLGGNHGPESGGNSPLTDGFQIFASTHVCASGAGTASARVCTRDEDCEELGLTETCDVGVTNVCIGSGVACNTDQDCKCVENPTGPGASANGQSANTKRYCEYRQDTECTSDGQCAALSPAGGRCLTTAEVGNRSGRASCFFEGTAEKPFNLAKPWDNDRDEDSDGAIDEYVLPNGPIRNFDITQVNGPDMRFTTLEDIYGDSGNTFQGALGFLITEGTPLIGDPGNSFGIAMDDMVVSWREFRLEDDTTSCAPSGSLGGQCATIQIENTNLYEGSIILSLSVTDPYPWSTSPEDVNDCNQDGDFTDTGSCLDPTTGTGSGTGCSDNSGCGVGGEFCVGADDRDCNDNGTDDIVARAVEATGVSTDEEIVAMDLQGATTWTGAEEGLWAGNLSISLVYDVDGTLFLQPGGGTDLPTVEIRYQDRDVNGNGTVCANDPDPLKEGQITATTTVAVPRGTVIVEGFRIEDHVDAACTEGGGQCGDGDAFADSNETLDLYLTLNNKTQTDLDNVIVRVANNEPGRIDCIINPFLTVAGGLAATGANSVKEVGPFTFKVTDLTSPNDERASENERFFATFPVTMTTNVFDALLTPQNIEIELDLDASGGGSPGTYLADFAGGGQGYGGGNFTSTGGDIDSGKNNLAASDGYRCQYNDPDFSNSNSYNATQCFLGFTSDANNGYDWHRHRASGGGAAPDGGRAHSGTDSLHWGLHTDTPAEDSSRLKQMDAIFTPFLNLGWDNVNPKLSMWQQVSFMDFRGSNTPLGESVDRGVVQLQVVNAGNTALTDWIKIAPFQNIYDIQGTDQFSNCLFDPIDDGNDEDSFFDPTDPNRTLGPSSTCFPEFVYGFQGDTNWQNPFGAANTGRASDPEFAEAGSISRGTWVETAFDLSPFKGRRVQFRFLVTTIEIGDDQDYIAAGFPNNSTFEDGWYIDDVQVADTLGSAATLNVDNSAESFIACPSACDEITPVLNVDVTASGGPGTLVELDGSDSTVGRCSDGTLQYQFWVDSNMNSTVEPGIDTLLQDFTDNPIFVDAPVVDTNYALVVRCTSDPSCPEAPPLDDADGFQLVTVACPSAVTISGTSPFDLDIRFTNANTIRWGKNRQVDIVRGSLNLLRNAAGDYGATVQTCRANNQVISQHQDFNNPGNSYYYLVRIEDPFCNETAGSYSTLSSGELGGSVPTNRDTTIANDADACADD